jgi:hypothetical protein
MLSAELRDDRGSSATIIPQPQTQVHGVHAVTVLIDPRHGMQQRGSQRRRTSGGGTGRTKGTNA